MTWARLAVITTAAAVVLAGCASPAAPTAEAPVADSLGFLDTPAAPVTAPPVTAKPKFVMPTDLPTADKVDVQGRQYGALPYPGVQLLQDSPGGAPPGRCTAGLLVEDPQGNRGFLTGGHCDEPRGAAVYTFADPDGSSRTRIGTYVGAPEMPEVRDRVAEAAGPDIDSAFLKLDVPPAAGSTTIAGRWPVAGVLSVDAVRTLPVGTPVCIDAARSHVRCGVLDIPAERRIYSDITVGGGDSGAALFGVDHDGNAWLLGTVTHETGTALVAGFAANALDRLHLDLVTAP